MVSLYRSDDEVKHSVEAEIKFDPSVQDDTHIAVTVYQGVVALSGVVKTYLDAYHAEKAAKRVHGVKGVANDIQVKLVNMRSDPDIAEEAARALRRELPAIDELVKPIVKNGVLTLEGVVEWNYQRELAERALRSISGVKSIFNLIQVRPKVAASDVKRKIQNALVRSAQVDAGRIMVEVDGGNVVLTGTVHTWAESQEAQRSAWSAPGVMSVENDIKISP